MPPKVWKTSNPRKDDLSHNKSATKCASLSGVSRWPYETFITIRSLEVTESIDSNLSRCPDMWHDTTIWQPAPRNIFFKVMRSSCGSKSKVLDFSNRNSEVRVRKRYANIFWCCNLTADSKTNFFQTLQEESENRAEGWGLRMCKKSCDAFWCVYPTASSVTGKLQTFLSELKFRDWIAEDSEILQISPDVCTYTDLSAVSTQSKLKNTQSKSGSRFWQIWRDPRTHTRALFWKLQILQYASAAKGSIKV